MINELKYKNKMQNNDITAILGPMPKNFNSERRSNLPTISLNMIKFNSNKSRAPSNDLSHLSKIANLYYIRQP